MYIDYLQATKDKIDKSDFLRVKKPFYSVNNEGYFEAGTIVKAKYLSENYDSNNKKYCELKVYPYFEEMAYPFLYTTSTGYVCAKFFVHGDNNEWFDEWFEPACEIHKIEQSYEDMKDKLWNKIDIIISALIIATVISCIALTVVNCISNKGLGDILSESLLVIFCGVVLCLIAYGIGTLIGKSKTKTLKQKFTKLMGDSLKN